MIIIHSPTYKKYLRFQDSTLNLLSKRIQYKNQIRMEEQISIAVTIKHRVVVRFHILHHWFEQGSTKRICSTNKELGSQELDIVNDMNVFEIPCRGNSFVIEENRPNEGSERIKNFERIQLNHLFCRISGCNYCSSYC